MHRNDIFAVVWTELYRASPYVPDLLPAGATKPAQQLYDELWFAVQRSIERYRRAMMGRIG